MASQQAPSRPWFRLASMVRPATQPQPQPQPPQPIRPPFPRPARPTQPQPQPQPQNSAPTPPPPLAASTPSTTISPPPPAVTAPVQSSPNTKASDSLPPSPKLKFSSPSSLPNSPAGARPVSSSSSTAQSPQTKALLAPSSSLPNSPDVARPVSSSSSAALSPQTKVLSPKNNPVSSPPSPLILPPALMTSHPERQPKNVLEKAEEKTVVVQEITLKSKLMPTPSNANYSPNGKQEAEKDMGKKEQNIFKTLHDSNGFGMKIITIAGENKGAVMERGSHKKHDNLIAGSNGKKSAKDSSSDEEGKSKMNGTTHKAKAKAWPRMTAFMNSNVQGVNNSILCDSSCTHHDPGVHLSLPAKPNSGKQS